MSIFKSQKALQDENEKLTLKITELEASLTEANDLKATLETQSQASADRVAELEKENEDLKAEIKAMKDEDGGEEEEEKKEKVSKEDEEAILNDKIEKAVMLKMASLGYKGDLGTAQSENAPETNSNLSGIEKAIAAHKSKSNKK